jgi:SAM-dependent methyltransferase
LCLNNSAPFSRDYVDRLLRILSLLNEPPGENENLAGLMSAPHQNDRRGELRSRSIEIRKRGVTFHLLQEVDRLFPRNEPVGPILDVGGGLGTYLAVIRSHRTVKDLVVYDISPPGPEKFDFVDYITSDVANLESALQGRTFPLVLFMDVIEHLYDPDKAAEQLWKSLAPGGFLVVCTPNLASLVNRLTLLIGVRPLATDVSTRRAFGRPTVEEVAGHIRNFTFRSLVEFLEFYEFKVVRAYTVPQFFADLSTRPSRYHRLAQRVDGMASLMGGSLCQRSLIVAQRPILKHQIGLTEGSL